MKLTFFSKADNEPSTQALPQALPFRKNQYQSYSEAEKQFMRDHWQTMTTAEIAQALGRSKASVSSTAWKLLKLRKTPAAKFMAASKGQNSRDDVYTEQERQYLRDNWQTKTIQQIAEVLGRTRGSVKSQGQKKMGLKKTHESLSALSRRSNAGQFQKGNLPVNTIYGDVQVIRIRHNKKRNIDTKYIRLGLAKWQEYQHYIWEQANGPVPKKMILAFINGDRMDVRLDNLKLITMAENAIRNSGTINLPDSFVSHLMAVRKPELRQELLKHPDLIDLKRTEIHLKRAIKQHDDLKPTKTRRSRKSHGR